MARRRPRRADSRSTSALWLLGLGAVGLYWLSKRSTSPNGIRSTVGDAGGGVLDALGVAFGWNQANPAGSFFGSGGSGGGAGAVSSGLTCRDPAGRPIPCSSAVVDHPAPSAASAVVSALAAGVAAGGGWAAVRSASLANGTRAATAVPGGPARPLTGRVRIITAMSTPPIVRFTTVTGEPTRPLSNLILDTSVYAPPPPMFFLPIMPGTLKP